MNEMGNNNTEHSDLREAYKTFVRQMSNWYNGGEIPELASQDLRFVLELQKQKLQSLGLDLKYELRNTGSRNVSGVSLSDRIFKNTVMGGYMDMTRSVGSSQEQLSKNTSDISLFAMIQELKDGANPSDNMALCCPKCGAPSTIGMLQDGCKFCGTKFIMSELYPKVMNYMINERYNTERTRLKNKRDLTILIAACAIPITIAEIIINLFSGQTPSMIMNIFIALFAGVFGGAMLGGIIFVFKKLFETFGLIGKGLRGGGHALPTVLRAYTIKCYDPEFSSEYFRDKMISLFRMAVYSKDASEFACCKCQCPERAADIIEAQLYNFSINSCKIKNMVCDAKVTLFLDCLHYKDGKVKSKSDKYRMHVRKRIKNPTELGFSFSAVNCPSCGASFDAHRVKACPYCNSEYLHEDHDWVVIDIK
ncbi:hypothetical protein [Ruminococcus flavefaciens]|uniref:hypothetical protein n=1 Tax=Ruminococcus flavefaciens TaxID=1265 RepID=UPI0026EA7DAB|nr:hypothetical protein [Ruminococcus flavefaciens]